VRTEQTSSERYIFEVFIERSYRGRGYTSAKITGVIFHDDTLHKTRVSGKGSVELALILYLSAVLGALLALLSHPAYVFALVACLALLLWVVSMYRDKRKLIAAIKRELSPQDD
jgi:uncharacterized membrane protein YfcA